MMALALPYIGGALITFLIVGGMSSNYETVTHPIQHWRLWLQGWAFFGLIFPSLVVWMWLPRKVKKDKP